MKAVTVDKTRDEAARKPEGGESAVEKTKAAFAEGIGRWPARVRGWVEEGIKYVREVWIELKNVTWPGRKEVTVSTGVVLVACVIMMIILWLLDIFFGFVMRWLLE